MAPPKRTSLAEQDIAALADGVTAGNRRVLAQAITLIESTRSDHRAAAAALLERLMPSAGNSIRLGISGVPGVGKSTFIEALGNHVIDAGHRVAVLVVVARDEVFHERPFRKAGGRGLSLAGNRPPYV